MNKFVPLTILLTICLTVVFLPSCNKETEKLDESVFGYDFFPLAPNKSWTYMSDSIVYSNGGSSRDTFKSFIREQVGEALVDASGNTFYKINRFFKRNETDNWTKINTWTVTKDKSRAIRTEENIKFVKLVFPIKKGLRFDGNVFVDEDLKIDVNGEILEPYKNWKHRIEEISEPFTFNGTNVPSLKINLVDETSIIDRRKVTEYYGENIGLVKKEMTILDSDGSRPNDPWDKKAQKGFIHTLTLIDYN